MKAEHTAVHATWKEERLYAAPASRVFAAFGDPVLRTQWNSPSETITIRTEAADFRVGGRNIEICVLDGQDIAHVETAYVDIVRDRRILFSETIRDAERLMGASLVTVEFHAGETGTRLALTVQTTAVDGSGLESGVVEGWSKALDKLGQVLGGN